MNRQILKNVLMMLAGGLAVTGASVFAATFFNPATGLNEFQSGDPASAAEVNDNFGALVNKSAVTVDCTSNANALMDAISNNPTTKTLLLNVVSSTCNGGTITRDNVTIQSANNTSYNIIYNGPIPFNFLNATLTLLGADNIVLNGANITGPSNQTDAHGAHALMVRDGSSLELISSDVFGGDNGGGLLVLGASNVTFSGDNEIRGGDAHNTSGNGDFDGETIALDVVGSSNVLFLPSAGTNLIKAGAVVSGVDPSVEALILDGSTLLNADDSGANLSINGFVALLTGSSWLGAFGSDANAGNPAVNMELELGSSIETENAPFGSLTLRQNASALIEFCTITGGINIDSGSSAVIGDCTISGTHPSPIGNGVTHGGFLDLAFGNSTAGFTIDSYNYGVINSSGGPNSIGGCGNNAVHPNNGEPACNP